MTTQFPDTCVFEGQKWAIEQWLGETDCVPDNESLGIETESPSTANWSGRIDHFMVYQGQLYLFKLEVNLAEASKDALPDGARREVLLRYEPWEICDSAGSRVEMREFRFEYLVFDDLPIPFTGRLVLSGPYLDDWEHPLPEVEVAEEEERITVKFVEGRFVEWY